MRFDFEWGITPADEDGLVEVHERLVGTELINRYGPFPARYAESIIRARRDFVQRTILSRTDAVKVFEPRPNLEALRLLQNKGHLDS
jgi:hypothetical protein